MWILLVHQIVNHGQNVKHRRVFTMDRDTIEYVIVRRLSQNTVDK